MKRRIFKYSMISLTYVLVAFIFFIIGYFTNLYEQGNKYRETEKLKTEAKSFFYKTIREVYMGTYNPKDGSVNEHLLKKFEDNEFRAKFNPICHLETEDFQHGDTFYGIVSSKSENIFEVELIKINGKWFLSHINSFNAKWFWKDITEDPN